MIKLLFICGSPRKAATAYAVEEAAKAAREVPEVETDIWYLAGKTINPCRGCNACVRKGSDSCIIYHDDMDEMKARFFDYDGVFIASPIYDYAITPQLSAFISRFRGEYINQKDNPLERMFFPGAAMAVGGTRNGGQESAINVILGFYHTQGMPVVNGGLGIYAGASIWSQDRMAEGAAEDTYGLERAENLAKKLALTAKALKYGKDSIKEA